MKTFTFSALCTISITTKIQAETLKEARELAGDRPLQGLCFQCSDGADSGGVGEAWITSGELDGTPTEIKLESEE